MFHTTVLILAFAVFVLGMVWKVSAWFRFNIGLAGEGLSSLSRLASAARGIGSTLASPARLLKVVGVFFADAVFQKKLLREDRFRWLMHISIYAGFVILVVLHAFDNYLVAPIYPGYAATLNPFLFIRDFAGVLVILGVGMAVYRRFIRKTGRPGTSPMDKMMLVLIGAIIASGFLLEGMKVVSQSAFRRMADEYTVMADDEDIEALEAYWAQNYGLSAAGLKRPFESAVLEKGASLNEMNCVQCHSNPKWGFGGYAVSIVLKPAASGLDSAGLPGAIQWVHFLSVLLFLAYLPFSKMLHIFAAPLSLMINAVMDSRSDPANVATRQMIELDACTHCGACTSRCSVAVVADEFKNRKIIPSERIAALKRVACGVELGRENLRQVQDAVFLCTNCDRCSVACPVGIELRDLWFGAREKLLKNSMEEFLLLTPLSFYRGLRKDTIGPDLYRKPLELTVGILLGEKITDGIDGDPLKIGEVDILQQNDTLIHTDAFAGCYSCSTCTNSCPVVHNYENPTEALGLLPHQVMEAAGLKCWDLVFNSRILWDCVGCYQCQDNCPQGVTITDIFYELKNRAMVRRQKSLT